MSAHPGGRVAWEDPGVSFPADLGLTWWQCLTAPESFFEGVRWEEPFARPLLYYVLMAVLAGTLGLFWYAWGPWTAAGRSDLSLHVELLGFFLAPFIALLGLGLAALLQHLFAALLAPARRGIGATARVLCYGGGVPLVTALLPPAFAPGPDLQPTRGTAYAVLYVLLVVTAQLWYLRVLVAGIRRAHSTTPGRALAVVLLPLALGLGLTLLLVIVAVALIAIAGLPV